MKYLFLLIFISIFIFSFAYAQSLPINKEDISHAKVVRVIDGNTFELENGKIIRLIGVDVSKADAREGEEAADFLNKFFKKDTKVFLAFDVQKSDANGRLLAYVYLEMDYASKVIATLPPVGYRYAHTQDDQYIFLNATILCSGYALPSVVPPNLKYADLFKELYLEALNNKRGWWLN